MVTPTEYTRLAMDRIRLAVLGHAATESVDTDGLAAALGVDRKRILTAIAQLQAANLLDDERHLNRDTLSRVGAALPSMEPPASAVLDGPWGKQEREILGRFFRGSRLQEIPSSGRKRRVVLERLAQEFEPGLRYEERQVNFTLQLFHPDYAALRRYLVDEGLLTRAEGVYWRTGGRTEE